MNFTIFFWVLWRRNRLAALWKPTRCHMSLFLVMSWGSLSNKIFHKWILSLLDGCNYKVSRGKVREHKCVYPSLYFPLHALQNNTERNNKQLKLLLWMFIIVSLYQVPEVTPTSTEAITSCDSLLVSCGAILEYSKVNHLDDENQYKYTQKVLPPQVKYTYSVLESNLSKY